MELWMYVVLSFLLSFGITALIVKYAYTLGLVAYPNDRSSHQQPTPHGGGIGMVCSIILIGALWVWQGQWENGWIVLGLSFLLALVGLIDDKVELSARVRLLVQFAVCAGIFILLSNKLSLTTGYGLSLFLVCVLGAWWINLFNFMDGIDGIAGLEAICILLGSVVLAVVFYPMVMGQIWWWLALCVAASVFGFLCLNWPPAKIFMGDVGSTWLAFIIFVIELVFVYVGWLNYAAVFILGAVFIADTTVTLLVRWWRREKWYKAHCTHAYQHLVRLWQGGHKRGHLKVSCLVGLINVGWLFPLAYFSLRWPEWAIEWIILAYAPILLGVFFLGAGKNKTKGE